MTLAIELPEDAERRLRAAADRLLAAAAIRDRDATSARV